MKKTLSVLLLLFVCMTVLVGCGCEHEWVEADCVKAKHCALCDKTEGEPLPHVWFAATCEAPQTCSGCGATEGEALGHSWVEATCEEAKNCTLCHLTEGEALGHSWQEATTEAPKTCEICAVTEGEKIVTDPRFTTAATKEIQGKWTVTMSITGEMMQIPDFPSTMDCRFVFDFQNDGTLGFVFELSDEAAFMDALVDYTMDEMYAEFANVGYGKEEADAAMEATYGMTTEEYVRQSLETMDFNALFAAIVETMNIGGVYYVEDGVLYTGNSWAGPMVAENYTLEGDTLIIDGLAEELGTDAPLVRMTEE